MAFLLALILLTALSLINPMETNKLLTLEEIEAIENSAKENNDQWNETVLRLEKVVGLLATARAYWELKNQPIGSSTYTITLNECQLCGEQLPATNMAITTCSKCQLSVKPADKPHPATLKVIVEAMKVIENSNASLTDIHIVSFRNGIQSLEKHLE